jgi:hypothetical protein
MRVPLSILDLVQVSSSSTLSEALQQSIDLARQVESWPSIPSIP